MITSTPSGRSTTRHQSSAGAPSTSDTVAGTMPGHDDDRDTGRSTADREPVFVVGNRSNPATR